ncbi:TPA: poly-beta-1,6 N-acetyl-D-glucosamine export porin PgaA [Klebsiella aerogenes]|nr:poly-beta-1,6 N-acetyl-D-glucosamine export porin PgaA [Klebsiella aerogenes]EIV7215465.1 poly-beta-1,6 N-acetyl-D-glucosamine export porin PgaA [Klebsiella aerogenes]EKZ5303325.1 poly-beta-1,6 N-acetyl-D-glucosamine export porin PgaA [Klebsiella aerogenes]HDT5498502.1 poly-beta-1,6 N-acetyl-D-glucosamine export porin PgaA [Klebsiella aerogenes]
MGRSTRFNKLFFYRRTTFSFSISLLLLTPILAQGAESIYDQHVLQAREGNYSPFLDYLQQYQQQHALTPEQVADWLQVASWAGRDEEVIQVWQRYQVYMALPARGTAAAAQAYRNQKRWSSALALWDQALSQQPMNDDYLIGRIKTLADARHDGQALSEARRLAATTPSTAHLQTLSYVYLRQGKSWDQLLTDMRAQELAPQNRETLNSLLESLSSNRISTPALQWSAKTTLTPAQQRKLEMDAAAEWVRLADTPTRGEQERFRLAQAALNRYDALFARWRQDPQAAEDLARARIDRLGALYTRGDYPQVIKEYQSLTAAQQPVPDWAIGWVISSYLAQQNVEAALAIARQHPLYRPDPQDDRHELFYALLDSGQYQAARDYLATLTNGVPYTRRLYGSPTPQPNDPWLNAQSLKVQYLLSTNALPEAERLSRRLAATAPGNQGLRIDYAAILQARGLPRAAERELKAAEALEPSNIPLERQQAYVAMDLQEWRQMELLTDDLLARSPEDLSTQKLVRAREVHHMSELRLNSTQGIHSDNPVSGSHDFSWDAAIYGPPIADNWRLFAGNRFAKGNFDEGKGSSRQLFGGIEWRPRDAWAELEISNNNFAGDNKPGARLSAWQSFNDRWQIGGEVERLSRQTPLRALRNGISANRGEGWVRWYQNERREYRFSAAASRFSDHNRRQEYTFSGKERLWQSPTITLDLEPGLSASANSRTDTLYYNPKRDFAATSALVADHVMYQHYDTVWSQQLAAGGGAYWQKAYSTGAIAMLGYGQRIRWNNVIDTGVMLNWDKRPYDGKRESNLSIALDANLRF